MKYLIVGSVIICGLIGNAAATDFHVWIDSAGTKHISNLPRHGFDHNGEIRRTYDPNSLAYQHVQMRNALIHEAEEIAAAEARVAQAESSDEVAPSISKMRPPKEGIMDLQELIQLERRAGKFRPDNR